MENFGRLCSNPCMFQYLIIVGLVIVIGVLFLIGRDTEDMKKSLESIRSLLSDRQP